MQMPELNKEDIDKATKQIAAIDFFKVTIAELELLLEPMFKGYRLNAPRFEPGIYLYRSRICDKPVFLSELSYPKDPKYIKQYGRANDIGKPMFYGSISKDIPFYELSACKGDTMIMSIWRTKLPLIVNHVGFTEDIAKILNSNRKLADIYHYVLETNQFSDLNSFVYNYIATLFARKVRPHENYFYKLSVALTNKLIGDFFGGMIYPTIAMSGNSDNIVLTPKYVDESLEFVSVELLEVTKVEGTKYTYRVLDTATQIDADEKIIWSGKYLGWDANAISAHSTGSDWIAQDLQGQRMNPVPTNPIKLNISKLEQQFVDAYNHCMKFTQEWTTKSELELIVCICSLCLDLDKKLRFLSIYIPQSIAPADVCAGLLNIYSQLLEMDTGQEVENRNQADNVLISTNKECQFNNEIYVFSENLINKESLAHLAAQMGLRITYIFNE